MKRYLSIFMLYVRSSIYKALGIFALMAVSQIVLFKFALDRAFNEVYRGLEGVISDSKVTLVFVAAFVLLTVALASVGCEFSGKQGYTLRRLSVSEKNIFFIQSACNGIFYILLLLVELAVMLFVSQLYIKAAPSQIVVSNQMVFLAFFRSRFLHFLMPLDDVLVTVRNIIWLLALAFSSAAFPFYQRRKKLCFSLIVICATVLVCFAWSELTASEDTIVIFVAALVVFNAIYGVTVREGAVYEK